MLTQAVKAQKKIFFQNEKAIGICLLQFKEKIFFQNEKAIGMLTWNSHGHMERFEMWKT